MLTGYLFVFEEACEYSIVFFCTTLFIPERTRYNTEVDGGGNMAFRIVHCNINVTDLNKSIAFYEQALGLQVARKLEAEDGSFALCYLQDDTGSFQIELTWLKDHPQPYELGENESHIAFATDDFEAAHRLQEEMGCICFENKEMGIYFIHDPDDYWLEVVPA